MKTKVILFVIAVAVVTLSFTFAGVHTPSQKVDTTTAAAESHNEPIGGMFADEVE